MRSFVRVMKALSDPSRVKIIKLLGRQEFCVCELQALLGLAQPTVSKHLKTLEEAGLVRFRKDGAWIIFRLAEESQSVYVREMLKNMADWLNDDPLIVEILGRTPGLNRARLCRRDTE